MHTSSIFRTSLVLAPALAAALIAAPARASLPSGTRLPATPIAAGALHAYQLQGGKLKGFGYDGDGRMGIGWTWNSRLTPQEVPGLTNVAQVAVGNAHTVVLKKDGTVWAWGYNNHGQVGDNTSNWINTPKQIAGLSGIKKVAAHDFSSYALGSDGKLYGWGANTSGQIGNGTFTDALKPTRVLGGLPAVADVGVGSGHVIAADTTGAVWTWGANNYGQLGDNTTTSQAWPKKLTSLSGITQVAAGDYFNAAVGGTGQLYTWGLGDQGQTGTGSIANRLVPIKITALPDVNMVVAGASHALALRKNAEVWAWGANGLGQQAYAGGNRLKPGKIALPAASSIAAGANNAFVATEAGQVLSWGANNNGVLGLGFSSAFEVKAAPAPAVRFPYTVLVAPVGAFTQAQLDAYRAWTAQLATDVLRLSYGQLQLNFDFAGPYPATSAQAGCKGVDSATDSRNVFVYGAKAAAAAGKDLSTYGTIVSGWGDAVALGCKQSGMNWGASTHDGAPANPAVSLHTTTATQIGTGLMWVSGGVPDNLSGLTIFEMGYGTLTATNPLDMIPGVGAVSNCDPNKLPSPFNCTYKSLTSHALYSQVAGGYPNAFPWTHNNDPIGMKLRSGWLSSSDVTTIDTAKCSTRLNIIPVEATTRPPNTSYGAKVSLPIPTGSVAPEESIYVEYRNDARVGPNFTNKPGVFVLFQDVGPYRMDLQFDAANVDGVSPLIVGTTYNITGNYKVLVNAVGKDANGIDRADVTITNASGGCL